MCRGNFIVEVAKLVNRMYNRGYHLPILWRKLKYNLKVLPLPYGDSTFHPLLTDISYQQLEQLFGLQNMAAWETYATPWANPASARAGTAWPPPCAQRKPRSGIGETVGLTGSHCSHITRAQ
jgi:hypothetical protein